jgi:hemerythrin-like domain-containing protein
MIAINLGDKPLAGFGEPIEMLKDCHRRIEHFLNVLRTVEGQFGERELTDDGRRALTVSLDYFANSAPRHTADEEHSLFPRVRRSENADARAVMAELDRLEHDHRRCEIGHALVDQLGRRWLDRGRLDEDQRTRLRAALDELASVYTAHIQTEEERVFPVASHILKADQIREVGEEMRARRSLTRTANSVEGSSQRVSF